MRASADQHGKENYAKMMGKSGADKLTEVVVEDEDEDEDTTPARIMRMYNVLNALHGYDVDAYYLHGLRPLMSTMIVVVSTVSDGEKRRKERKTAEWVHPNVELAVMSLCKSLLLPHRVQKNNAIETETETEKKKQRLDVYMEEISMFVENATFACSRELLALQPNHPSLQGRKRPRRSARRV